MNSSDYVFALRDVKKTLPGGREIFKRLNLQFLRSARIGVIGANGAGKSTLLRIMAGLDQSIEGETWLANGAKVGYLPQEPTLDNSLSASQNVRAGSTEMVALLDEFQIVSHKLAEVSDPDEMTALLETQASLQERIEAQDGWDLDRRIDQAIHALRCPSDEAQTSSLSGGERRRVALARLLVQSPDVLLLDEPTNHLDAESAAWLQTFLSDYRGMMVVVTHDRYFLDHVTGWILEIERGQGLPFEGNYSTWLESKQKRLAQEGREADARRRQIERERDWMGQSPKARQSKSKARINRFKSLTESHEESPGEALTLRIPPGRRLGDVVVRVKNASKAFSGKALFTDLSFDVPAGAVVGVVGPNGVGKTTLLRLIVGQDTPDSGSLTLGETVDLCYVDQSRDAVLDPRKTVFEEIADGLDRLKLGGGMEMASRAYVALFNFRGPDQQKRIGDLSGGERNRVQLAKTLKKGGNLLLLDEPTNDLDLETLRALEEAIDAFAGSALISSHDRFFLDRLATHLLIFDGKGHATWFDGNFDDYARQVPDGILSLDRTVTGAFRRLT